MTSRNYNHKFEKKERSVSHYKYKSTFNKRSVSKFYFITDQIVAPILDQGTLGSCVANAAHSLFYILSNQQINLSRLHLYYISRAIDGSSSTEDTGTYVSTALHSLFKYGLANENLWEYDIDNFSVLSPSVCFNETYTLKNYSYKVVLQNIEDLTNCLSEGNPIIIGMLVYSSFESNDINKTGLIPMPNTKKESLLGGHCLLIIGYDLESKYFKVQNSWGSNWGSSGYCFIPFDYILDPDLTIELFTVTFSI